MSEKLANAGAALIASIGMAFAALGIIGVHPSPPVYNYPPTECNK
jgi:hypothetical protein